MRSWILSIVLSVPLIKFGVVDDVMHRDAVAYFDTIERYVTAARHYYMFLDESATVEITDIASIAEGLKGSKHVVERSEFG